MVSFRRKPPGENGGLGVGSDLLLPVHLWAYYLIILRFTFSTAEMQITAEVHTSVQKFSEPAGFPEFLRRIDIFI